MMKTMYVAAIVLALLPRGAMGAANDVRITKIDNINMGSWGLAAMSGNDPVCVYRNNAANNTYMVRATDDASGGFRLQGTQAGNAGSLIPYTLTWGNTPSPGTTQLGDGVTANASGAHTTSQTCSGGNTANFKVDVANSALAAVPAGTYRATITFQISR